MYSVDEKIFWVQTHLQGSSFREVCGKFHTKYRNRPIPHNATVKRCYDRFQRTGCVEYHRTGSHPQRAESSNELVVLASVNANCRRSTNEMARETGLSQSTVHRILRKHKYHPFKFRQHQELRPGDNERRMEFAMLVLERIDNDPYFVRNILFTDESSFNLHHGPNPQNVRHWAQVNPNAICQSHATSLQAESVSRHSKQAPNWSYQNWWHPDKWQVFRTLGHRDRPTYHRPRP